MRDTQRGSSLEVLGFEDIMQYHCESRTQEGYLLHCRNDAARYDSTIKAFYVDTRSHVRNKLRLDSQFLYCFLNFEQQSTTFRESIRKRCFLICCTSTFSSADLSPPPRHHKLQHTKNYHLLRFPVYETKYEEWEGARYITAYDRMKCAIKIPWRSISG